MKVSDYMTLQRYETDSDDGKKNLIYFLFFCEQLKQQYEAAGIPEQILLDTLHDLVIWTKDWTNVKGTLHLGQLDWLSRHFSMKLFRLGKLQFCLGEAEEDIPEFKVYKGDNVIEIHIPAEGKLDTEECKKSIEAAKPFFEKYFPEHKYSIFTCHSWLLDRDLSEFLPETSNIIKFGNLFTRVKDYDSNALIRYTFRWDTNELNLKYAYSGSAFSEKIKAAVLHGRVFHETLGAIKA